MADLMKALRDAQKAANKAVRTLDARLQSAGPDELADLTDQYNAALTLEDDANQRIVNEILNPGGNQTIARLETATARLEERIKKYKAQEESLGQLAAGLNILAQVVRLVLLA